MNNLKEKIDKIVKFVLLNKITIVGIIALIVIPILVHMGTENNQRKKVLLSAYNQELSLHKRNSFDGKKFVTGVYPIFRDVMLIGDSYAYFIGTDLGGDVTNYSCPGFTINELESTFELATECKKKYVVIFIGPNDFTHYTSLDEFSDGLKKRIKLIEDKMGATIIIPTYLHCVMSDEKEKEKDYAHTIDEYNAEIMKISNEDSNVHYLDLKDLDRHKDFRKDTPLGPDKVHYNYDFSVKFINKVYDKIMDIRKDEILNG